MISPLKRTEASEHVQRQGSASDPLRVRFGRASIREKKCQKVSFVTAGGGQM